MNVLSLCDGMSCAMLALERAGIKVDNYFSSEIKPVALDFQKYHYLDKKTRYGSLCKNFVQLGDVHKVSYNDGVLTWEGGSQEVSIDLVCFGSPCQSLSRAMKQDRKIGLDDPVRSGIFFECERVLKEVGPRYFFMENVVMDKESKGIISSMLGVEPVFVDSALVSAQMRRRLYWTNIPGFVMPEDKGITYQSILRDGYVHRDKARCLAVNHSHGYTNGTKTVKSRAFHRFYDMGFLDLVFSSKEDYEKICAYADELSGGKKTYNVHYLDGCDESRFDGLRFLWKDERARLQTVPEDYVDCLSEKDAADLLGDGWTVEVIALFFKGMKDCT